MIQLASLLRLGARLLLVALAQAHRIVTAREAANHKQ
jgi:hypothetical protein